jgi:hypothetical protein
LSSSLRTFSKSGERGATGSIFLADQPLHVTQRGLDRQAVFFGPDDYARYRDWLTAAAQEYSCTVHAYVLMTNHVHLLVTPAGADSLPMWEGHYRAAPIETPTVAASFVPSCPSGGLVELIDRSGSPRQPISLDYGNTVERPPGLAEGELVFGGIVGEFVVGQLVIQGTGAVRLVHPNDGLDVAKTWSSFDNFIFAELDRLGPLHNMEGELAEKHLRLPLEARRWEVN